MPSFPPDSLRSRIHNLAAQLRAHGVKLVRIRYDGANNSGLITAILFDPDVPSAHILHDAVSELYRDFLTESDPGWADEFGSCGLIVWDLDTDRIDHSHSRRELSYKKERYCHKL